MSSNPGALAFIQIYFFYGVVHLVPDAVTGCPFSTGQPVPVATTDTKGSMRPVQMEVFLVVRNLLR